MKNSGRWNKIGKWLEKKNKMQKQSPRRTDTQPSFMSICWSAAFFSLLCSFPVFYSYFCLRDLMSQACKLRRQQYNEDSSATRSESVGSCFWLQVMTHHWAPVYHWLVFHSLSQETFQFNHQHWSVEFCRLSLN